MNANDKELMAELADAAEELKWAQARMSRILSKLAIHRKSENISEVVGLAADFFRVPGAELVNSRSRAQPFNSYKQMTIAACCVYTTNKIVEIGKYFGLDHSTVIYCRNKYCEAIDPFYRDPFEELCKFIQQHTAELLAA